MTTHIHFVDIKADPKIEDNIRQRLEKADKKYGGDIIHAHVSLRVENFSGKRQKSCMIELNVPGSDVVVKSEEDTFDIAIDEAFDELETRLRKQRQRMIAH